MGTSVGPALGRPIGGVETCARHGWFVHRLCWVNALSPVFLYRAASPAFEQGKQALRSELAVGWRRHFPRFGRIALMSTSLLYAPPRRSSGSEIMFLNGRVSTIRLLVCVTTL